jgi:hypothetical protein
MLVVKRFCGMVVFTLANFADDVAQPIGRLKISQVCSPTVCLEDDPHLLDEVDGFSSARRLVQVKRFMDSPWLFLATDF